MTAVIPTTLNTVRYGDRVFRILASSSNDHIAKHLASGSFYEEEDLELIQRVVKPGSVIADVGANIGNHTIFFDQIMRAKKVFVFDVSPTAISILLANIAINSLRSVDTRFLGVGLSGNQSTGTIATSKTNLGLTTVVQVEEGQDTIDLVKGDDLLAQQTQIDLFKIDVEGGEISVLEGIANTIERCRPSIFIEVQDLNMASFVQWLDAANYVVVDSIKRYKENTNFMLVPHERSTTLHETEGV